jgi:hypothetical protein
MGLIYANYFNKLYWAPLPHISTHPSEDLTGFIPAVDPKNIGRMNVAANGVKAEFAIAQPGQPNDLGTPVAVIAPPTTTPQDVISESIYATLPNGFLVNDMIYEATLIFDSPYGENGPPTWAVGLFFKAGGITDYPTDKRAGITCQFSGLGEVKFHFTTYNGPDADLKFKYNNDFAPNPRTGKDPRFTLTLTIWEGANNSVEGTGALKYLNVAIPPSPLKPIGTPPTFDQLKVVGTSLATTTGGAYGVRLLSFAMASNPTLLPQPIRRNMW